GGEGETDAPREHGGQSERERVVERHHDHEDVVRREEQVHDHDPVSRRVHLPEDDAAERHPERLEREKGAVGADALAVLLLHESRQEGRVRRHRDHQDERGQEDADPEPGDAGDVRNPARDLAKRSFRLLRLDRTWARGEHQHRGDGEAEAVEREHRGRAGEAVERAGQRRARHERALAGEADQRVRRGDVVLVDDERDDAAEGRVEEPVAEAVAERQRDQQPEVEVPGGVHDGQHGHHGEAGDIGDDHQRPARVAVGESAADQQRREHRRAMGQQDDRERALRAGQRERLPPQRDEEGAVAPERDRLPPPGAGGSPWGAGRGARGRARWTERRLPPPPELSCQPMSGTLRVACVQLTSRSDKAANLEKTEPLVAKAAATGADIVVLPEKWNAIGNPEQLHAAAETLEEGESVEAMSRWAKTLGITLVGGSITERRDGREKPSNTSIVFDSDGSVAGLYRKIHLFDVEVGGLVYRESEAEEPGDEPVVLEAEGWPLGLTVCY